MLARICQPSLVLAASTFGGKQGTKTAEHKINIHDIYTGDTLCYRAILRYNVKGGQAGHSGLGVLSLYLWFGMSMASFGAGGRDRP